MEQYLNRSVLQNCLLMEELIILLKLGIYSMINKHNTCGLQLLYTLKTFENCYSVKAQCFQRVITYK